MKLSSIQQITGQIEVLSGLHIGSGNTEMHIGGTDNPIIKNPITHEPYIPGSSIKGKMRSLMEWKAGLVNLTNGKPVSFKHLKEMDKDQKGKATTILKLFGGAPDGSNDENADEISVSRLSFWDSNLSKQWVENIKGKNVMLTEVKMENTINRISGTDDNPRNTERVPAGAIFDFKLTIRQHDDEDMTDAILEGFKLLELTGLGGSGSRGYGKIQFNDLKIADESLMGRLDQTQV